MDEIVVELPIFTPRWGHDDIYKVRLRRETIEISNGARTAKCSWRENLDPEWSGESLSRILSNDHIYQPEILEDLLAHAWQAWRAHELDDQGVNTELQAVATWLNTITKAKPKTKFWTAYF